MKLIYRLLITLSVCSFLTSQVFGQYDEGPSYEDPGYEDPGYEDPGYEDPGYEDPGYEDPGYEDPGYEDPGYEDPGYEDPGTEDPSYEEEYGLFTQADLDAARAAGRAEVTKRPSSYNLFTKAQHDANFVSGRTAGRADVTQKPSNYNLFTKAQHDANFVSGRTAGRADVTKRPSDYNLFTKAQHNANFANGRKAGQSDVTKNPAKFRLLGPSSIPVLRVAAAKGSAISFSLPGKWSRFAQSGMPKKGWKFDAKTGLLTGSVPRAGTATVRLTPYQRANAGAQLTLQIQAAGK